MYDDYNQALITTSSSTTASNINILSHVYSHSGKPFSQGPVTSSQPHAFKE